MTGEILVLGTLCAMSRPGDARRRAARHLFDALGAERRGTGRRIDVEVSVAYGAAKSTPAYNSSTARSHSAPASRTRSPGPTS